MLIYKKTTGTSLLFLTTALIALVLPLNAFALGVSPATVQVDGLLKDNSVTREMVVTRSDTSKTELMNISFDGAIVPYVSLSQKATTLTLPAGEKQVLLTLIITPKNAPVGTYKGTMRIRGDTSDLAKLETTAATTAVAGVEATIVFSVTAAQTQKPLVERTQVTWNNETSEVSLNYIAENNGNTVTSLGDVTIRISNVYTGEKVDVVTVRADTLAPLNPFSRVNAITPPLKLNLREGFYNALTEFHDAAGGVIFTSPSSLLKVGSPTIPGYAADKNAADKGLMPTVVNVALGLLLASVVVLGLMRVLRPLKKKHHE